jgi:hypothetical protein
MIYSRGIDGKYSVRAWNGTAGPLGIIKNVTGDPIPEDEPLFLFRAKDQLAIQVLQYYRELCLQTGSPAEHLRGIDGEIQVFTDFAQRHPERMKQPGITRGL